jgi:hypothetical protein
MRRHSGLTRRIVSVVELQAAVARPMQNNKFWLPKPEYLVGTPHGDGDKK